MIVVDQAVQFCLFLDQIVRPSELSSE